MEANKKRLVRTDEAQQTLISVIDNIVEVERMRAEIGRANSIANLNYSKAALESRVAIKKLLEEFE